MTTERKNTAGGRWADTKDMERQASNSNVMSGNGEVDESTMPLNPKKPDNKSSVNKRKYGRSKTGYLCHVQLLDGNEFEVDVPTSANGQVLFDKVCDHINLAERDYFSLSYRDRADVKFWLDHSKKISKQIGNGTFMFAFEVKFYPTEPETMREDFTRYLLFLQLRTDILTGRLPCSFVTHALLASYAIQSDVGDYETDSHGSGFEYLLNTEFAPSQGEELLEKVSELHRTHRGLTPEEAELEYLTNAKKLAMYGIELHQAKDKEGDVTIGVCASGLLVYRGKLRIHRFSWPKILKIAYKRNKFTIYVRPGEFEQTRNKLVYELVSYTMAKKLWKIAVEHHGFFRLKEPESPMRAMFPLFGSKFRYSGRTQYQSRSDPKDGSRPTVRVDRSASSRRFAPTRPMDTSGPTFSTERKEEVISASDHPITTLDLRNRTNKRTVPYASVEEDPNLTGMDEGQVSLMRNPGSPNYGQVGWAKPKGGQGYGAPATYHGTPWDQQGFQLCDQNGRPLRAGHNGPIFIKYGTPIVQSEKQLSDMYGNPIPHNYDGKVYDREGNPIADSPGLLYDRYGNPINWPSHRGPAFGIYGKPQMQDIYDGEHKPVKPTHVGPIYDSYGNPCVPVEVGYGRNMRPAGYDKPGYQLCDEYGYPLQPSHEGQILIKYGIPIARGPYELCDINGIPITRDYDGPIYDRWGNLLAPGIENLYDEYGNPIYLATHDGPVYGRYGMPILVDLYDKDGRLVRPGHRGQVYDVHRQILIPLEVLDDGNYGNSTFRRQGPPTLEKPPSRISGMNIRDSKGNLISTSPYPLAEGEDGLPPYANRDSASSPYSVTTTTRTTTRTYRGTDGTMVTEHKTEKDGVIETRIEKKTTIVTQVDETNDIDFDKLLSAAIMGATELNPDMAVEKIEIHTEAQ